MCAEIETVVTRLIKERIGRGTDEAASNFLRSLRRSVIRNATFKEIRDKIGLLGSNYKLRFENIVDNEVGEEGISSLGNAVEKRDQAAHDVPPNITFSDLEEAYRVATIVVDAVRLVLET